MTPQQLKNSILQLAVQGKLVEQRPEEGTGKDLYREIQKENIATDKSEPAIAEDDIPFDVPESWKVVYIRNVAILYNGRAYKQNELLESGKYPVLRVGNLFTRNKWYYSDLELEPQKYCDKGDLLYSWSASFGPYIWNGGKVIYHYHIWKIQFSRYVDKKFFYYFLLADTDNIKRSGHGLAMIHVTKSGTEKRFFPLPSLAEQKRIVAKIEELLPLVDRYEKAWSQLEAYNKRFPADMQKAILQWAIQGKLVEQRPEEGTGEELYREIQAEKARLVKAGTIRKEKPLPEIAESELPFEIPENWKWVRLPAITYNVGNKTNQVLAKDVLTEGKYPAVSQSADLIDGYANEKEKVIYDLPLIMFGDHTRNVKYIDFPFIISADGTKFMKPIVIYPVYLYYWMKITAEHLRNRGYARHFSLLVKELVPLPPLAEQKRIVAKIEELLPLCDALKGKVS